jgi:predicted ABC-type ATPase
MRAASPQVVVLAGPNGAGKSTIAATLLRDRFGILTFVNADAIAAGLSGFAPSTSALAAGRLMLERLRELAATRESFAFETTLASRSFAPWLRTLAQSGYRVSLVFLWLPRVSLALARIRARVALGGHAVPPAVVRRRYARGIANFHRIYAPLAASWWFYDNSGRDPRLIASAAAGRTDVLDHDGWQRTQQT